jgi:hypothetical protein
MCFCTSPWKYVDEDRYFSDHLMFQACQFVMQSYKSSACTSHIANREFEKGFHIFGGHLMNAGVSFKGLWPAPPLWK